MAWFRRGKKSADAVDAGDAVDATTSDTTGSGDTGEAGTAGPERSQTASAQTAESSDGAGHPAHGPFDAADVTSAEGYLKLGAIWVPAIEGLMLTFEMDQSQSQVTAVQVVHADSTIQLQAFAAPKSGGLWQEIRTEIAESLENQGATATEESGDHGTELLVHVNGGVMRFLGVDGPRWFLRGVVSGRAAVDPEAGAALRALFVNVVVDRGGEAMGPRELLALTLPADGDASADGQDEQDGEEGQHGQGEQGRRASDLDPFTRGPEITEIR